MQKLSFLKKILRNIFKPADLFLFAIVLLVSIVFSFWFLPRREVGALVEVRYGDSVEYFFLKKNCVIEKKEGKIFIRIEDGCVSIVESDCPDRVCVLMGPIRREGEVLICVPNKLVVKITGRSNKNDQDSFDSISF